MKPRLLCIARRIVLGGARATTRVAPTRGHPHQPAYAAVAVPIGMTKKRELRNS
jgi:hypothetical protein